MVIRRAMIKDLIILSEMWQLMAEEIAIDGTSWDDEERVKYLVFMVDKINDPNYAVYVGLDEDGNYQGFISGFIETFAYGIKGISGFCNHLYVYKKYRGKKIAPQLMEALKLWATINGADKFEFITAFDLKLVNKWNAIGCKPVSITFKEVI